MSYRVLLWRAWRDFCKQGWKTSCLLFVLAYIASYLSGPSSKSHHSWSYQDPATLNLGVNTLELFAVFLSLFFLFVTWFAVQSHLVQGRSNGNLELEVSSSLYSKSGALRTLIYPWLKVVSRVLGVLAIMGVLGLYRDFLLVYGVVLFLQVTAYWLIYSFLLRKTRSRSGAVGQLVLSLFLPLLLIIAIQAVGNYEVRKQSESFFYATLPVALSAEVQLRADYVHSQDYDKRSGGLLCSKGCSKGSCPTHYSMKEMNDASSGALCFWLFLVPFLVFGLSKMELLVFPHQKEEGQAEKRRPRLRVPQKLSSLNRRWKLWLRSWGDSDLFFLLISGTRVPFAIVGLFALLSLAILSFAKVHSVDNWNEILTVGLILYFVVMPFFTTANWVYEEKFSGRFEVWLSTQKNWFSKVLKMVFFLWLPYALELLAIFGILLAQRLFFGEDVFDDYWRAFRNLDEMVFLSAFSSLSLLLLSWVMAGFLIGRLSKKFSSMMTLMGLYSLMQIFAAACSDKFYWSNSLGELPSKVLSYLAFPAQIFGTLNSYSYDLGAGGEESALLHGAFAVLGLMVHLLVLLVVIRGVENRRFWK